ncbi:MAG: TOBE domain-containing protein [Clostridiales bacterium]|nr:TOBE domain-containing protein [Clostridiales bacterium]
MVEDNKVEFGDEIFDCIAEDFKKDENVNVFILPQDIEIVGEEEGQISGEVESFKYKGDDYEINVKCEGFTFVVHTYEKVRIGSIVWLKIDPDKIKIKRREESQAEYDKKSL